MSPTLTQTFASFGDTNWYALAPGETYNRFTATGWVLTGGARVVSTTLSDGTPSQVLDLPSGSTASSPLMCVTSDYPTARAMVRNVAGSAGVNVSVAYPTWGGSGIEQGTGIIRSATTAWSLSRSFQIVPGNQPGWQLAQFKLVATGTQSEYQLYNLYIDPRMT
ncbi:MAG: hypothetical protein ACJ76X_02440 [Solirubrobacteraceae bacterium]